MEPWHYPLHFPLVPEGKLRIGVDNMAFTTCSVATNVIASLGTTPEERGLTTDEFKAKFDQFATEFVAWFNTTHLAELVETGTFTPVLSFGGNSVGITYTRQLGRYTKIGRAVFIEIEILLSSKGTSTGEAAITGLPFPTRGAAPYEILNCEFSNLTIPSEAITVNFLADTGNILSGPRYTKNNGYTSVMNDTNFAASTNIRITGFYTVD
jgi:hypothetical protein